MPMCSQCGSPRIYRSRSRSAVEKTLKLLRRKRLYRCHACGWRGWSKVPNDDEEDEEYLDDVPEDDDAPDDEDRVLGSESDAADPGPADRGQ